MICAGGPVDVSDEYRNRTRPAQGSYSRSSTPSFEIDGMDDDDEPSVARSQAQSDEQDLRSTVFNSEDSDDDLYQSVKSDVEDDYVSWISSRSS